MEMAHYAHALITRWFEEVWNKNNIGAVDELMAPDGIAYDFPVLGQSVDREGFKAAVQAFQAIFSDIHTAVEDVLADGDRAAMRWTATMTHTGDGLGFAPKGKQIHLKGINMAEFRDGKIVIAWNALDLAGPLAELRAASEASE
jgi:steroid delta-isomerase-like uncharacterized protein